MQSLFLASLLHSVVRVSQACAVGYPESPVADQLGGHSEKVNRALLPRNASSAMWSVFIAAVITSVHYVGCRSPTAA